MKEISAVIVDDEPLARANIREALRSTTSWQIACELGSSTNALATIGQLSPEVVFLDIQMPGQSGIELAVELLALEPPPLVVFVTAFDQYAIQAFELFAFDYLLKPFDDARFERSVRRIERCLAETSERRAIQRHQASYRGSDVPQAKPLERLVIRSVGSIRIVKTLDIYWLRASGNYVEVGHRDGVHLQRVQLSFLEKHLDPLRFFRTHRSAIIALAEAVEYRHGNDDNGVVLTRDGSEIPVSSRYREALFEKLGIA